MTFWRHSHSYLYHFTNARNRKLENLVADRNWKEKNLWKPRWRNSIWDVYLGNPPDSQTDAGHAVITFCHLFWESDFFAFVSFALTTPSWVPCYRAAHDSAQSRPELTPCPILAVGGSNGSMSRNGSKYGGGGGFTTPTKDYEPVGGDRQGNADLNGSSRLNGNGRPDVYDIPSGKYMFNTPIPFR